LIVLERIKIASCLVHGIVILCHFTNPCTSYRICVETLFFKKSQNFCLKDWEIVSDDIHPTCSMNQTWIEPSNSTKPSVTPTIRNLSFFQGFQCLNVCFLLWQDYYRCLYRTRVLGVTHIVVIGEAANFVGFITAILHFLLLIPSPESLITFTRRILLGPARDPSSGLEGFREFLEELFNELLHWGLWYSSISFPVFLK